MSIKACMMCLGALAFAACVATAPVRRAPAQLFANICALCGKSFAGVVRIDEPASADNPFAGKTLVMHVRDCEPDTLRIPFHVGDDRSRTWIIRRTEDGLQLKHDHRHADGSSDVLTMYGGSTQTPGSTARQEFPADAESKTLFMRENRSGSIDNIWAIEATPLAFVYELRRPNRLFRVEFDLTHPVATPAAAWGYQAN